MTAVGPLGNTDMSYRIDTTMGVSAQNPTDGAGRLVLPIWAGEVINAYDQYNIFEAMVDSKTISSGTTMEFPVTGYVDLKSTWEAGEELTGGTNSKATTFRIALDKRPMAAHFELDNVDLMLTQWEFRSELARQAGRTLADARDRQIASFLCRAAAENGLAQDPRATDWFGGSAVGGLGGKIFCNNKFDNLGLSTATAANRTDAALKLLEKIEEFQIRLQEVDAPTEGVFCAVTPRTFQDIRALGVARDSSDLAGGAGRPFFGGVADAGGLGAGLQQGMFNLADRLEYQGCTIVKTNHLPTTNLMANKIGEKRYNRSFHVVPTKAIIWQQACVASLRLTGLKVDQVDDIRRNTVFTVASMMGGTGVLKPEHAAVCIGSFAPTARGNANDVMFSGKVDGTILEFGDFEYDATTGDLTAYDTDPDGGGSPSTDVTANTDALVRDAYQAALGADTLDANGDGTATSVSGYSTEGDFVKEYVDAANIDNFGVTGQDDGLGG
tara:strand:+ start:3628 stop:5118 length:1491 start_codon:yes stop_codon:yes gene_type:complete